MQALFEDRIVEHLPGFIDDDEGRTAILDHPLDAAEEIGEKRRALGSKIKDLRHVDADHILAKADLGSRPGPKEPAMSASLPPFPDPAHQIALVVGRGDKGCEAIKVPKPRIG